MNAKLKTVLKFVLVGTVLYFVVSNFSQNWSKVAEFTWSLDYFNLAVSVGLHLVTFLLFSKVWCWLIGAYGHSVSLKSAFKIAYLANLGRYAPGKIWPVFGMAYLAEQVGVKKRESVSSWVIALVYANSASLLAAVVLAFFNQTLGDWLRSVAPDSVLVAGAVFAVVGAATLILKPELVSRFLNFVLKLLKRESVTLEMSRGIAAKVFIGYVVCWIFYGVSFWLFANSLFAEGSIPFVAGVGSFIIAYQVGYLAFFSPGGVGVRELALVVLLKPYVGEAVYGIALAARLWNLVVEILSALIALRIKLK